MFDTQTHRKSLMSSLLCFFAEEKCAFGIVGEPVSLPCLFPALLNSENYSIEWRRDDEVVLRAVFVSNKNVEELGANSASLLPDAPLTGNFSLTLPAVDAKAPKVNYSLFVVSENQSAAMCTVCLRVAGQSHAHAKQTEAQPKELTPVCLQPVSVYRCCGGRRPRSRGVRRPSSVTPEAVSPNPEFTGSSTTRRRPQRTR